MPKPAVEFVVVGLQPLGNLCHRAPGAIEGLSEPLDGPKGAFGDGLNLPRFPLQVVKDCGPWGRRQAEGTGYSAGGRLQNRAGSSWRRSPGPWRLQRRKARPTAEKLPQGFAIVSRLSMPVPWPGGPQVADKGGAAMGAGRPHLEELAVVVEVREEGSKRQSVCHRCHHYRRARGFRDPKRIAPAGRRTQS